jgi:hypothetical protein
MRTTVGMQNRSADNSGRVTLPLLGHDATPEVAVTNADIEAALEAEDIERHVGPGSNH